MAMIEIQNARRAITACTALALLWTGCANLDDATKDLALQKSPSAVDAGTAAADNPSSAVAPTSTTAQAGKPPAPTDPGKGDPGGPAGCKMQEDPKQVCVVCRDAKGNVVRDGCYTKDPQPAGAECHDIKRVDGSLCTVCFDAGGMVIKSSCRVPDANGCAMPGTPPGGAPIACKEYDDKGQHCTVCYDGAGQVVKQGCSDGAPADPGAACDESKHADGTVCTVCRDPKGNIVKKGCTAPVPPADPGDIKCVDTDEKGVHCTVCTDAQGKEIKRGCWETMPGMPADPSCKQYRSDDGKICVICVDGKGTIVKQTCGMSAPPPTTSATPVPGNG